MAFWQYPQMMLWQLQIIGNHHHITLVSTIAMPFFGNALPWQRFTLAMLFALISLPNRVAGCRSNVALIAVNLPNIILVNIILPSIIV